MPTDNVAFVGSIPENYDRYLGPVLFEPYARDLAERVTVPAGGALLEVACGTGIVTRQLRDYLDKSVQVVATDLNQAMIDYAARKFNAAENIAWKQADALDLPFPDRSFDAVVCQFGLMFFPDKQKAAREAYRTLKPNGQFIVSVWDHIAENDLANAAQAVITRFFPENPPDFYDVPFSFHERDSLVSLLSAAGFRDVQVAVIPFPSSAPSARHAARGLIRGNPVITAINERDPAKAPQVEAELAAFIAERFGDAPVRARMQALVCMGMRP